MLLRLAEAVAHQQPPGQISQGAQGLAAGAAAQQLEAHGIEAMPQLDVADLMGQHRHQFRL